MALRRTHELPLSGAALPSREQTCASSGAERHGLVHYVYRRSVASESRRPDAPCRRGSTTRGDTQWSKVMHACSERSPGSVGIPSAAIRAGADQHGTRPRRLATMAQAFVEGLSDTSRYYRLFVALGQLSPTMLDRFTLTEFPNQVALIGIAHERRHFPRRKADRRPGVSWIGLGVIGVPGAASSRAASRACGGGSLPTHTLMRTHSAAARKATYAAARCFLSSSTSASGSVTGGEHCGPRQA
jgi:hypothetical protein